VYEPLRQSAASRTARVDARVAGVADGLAPDIAAIVDRSARLDATVLDLATDAALGGQDLLTMYLPGLDIAQHALFPESPAESLAPAAAAERVRALDGYYAFLDRVIGATVLRDAPPSLVTMLVTQPGRVAVGPATASGSVLALAGPIAATGHVETMALSAEALAPTVLRVLGVPVAADLAATAADALVTPAFMQAFPVRPVATYGERRTRPAASTGQPLDREMIERMRSLGYVR